MDVQLTARVVGMVHCFDRTNLSHCAKVTVKRLPRPKRKSRDTMMHTKTIFISSIAFLFLLAGCSTPQQVSEAEIRQEYDRLVATVPTNKTEYLVRHIMVGSQQQAQVILDRLKNGESFSTLARVSSMDTGSSGIGGDLGWSQPEWFVEEFSRTMVSLAPRGLAPTPTQTQFGWHVIELQAVRPLAPPKYEEVRDRIEQSLRRKSQRP